MVDGGGALEIHLEVFYLLLPQYGRTTVEKLLVVTAEVYPVEIRRLIAQQ